MPADIPHLSVSHSRVCQDEGDLNCFRLSEGCTAGDFSTICKDDAGWSASLAFIGTGIEVFAFSEGCTKDTCKLTIDDVEQEWQGDLSEQSAFRPMIYAPDLEGGEDAQHTLVISSDSNELELEIFDAIVHTGLDTPVHSEDTIWINARSSALEYEGSWENVDDSTVPEVSRPRELTEGTGSVSVGIIADSFRFHWITRNANIELSPVWTWPNWTVSIDGVAGSQTEVEQIELDSAGWHHVNLTGTRTTLDDDIELKLNGLSYHPLPNVTRIGDIVLPEIGEGNADGSGMRSGGDAEGGALGLREPFGSFFLLPAVLACYMLRLKL